MITTKLTRTNTGAALVVRAALIVTLLTASVAYCAPKGYVSHVTAALGHLESGKTREGLSALKEAIACNANDALAHVALGLVLLCGGRGDDASAEFGAALQLEKDCAEANYGLGLVHLGKGEFGPATAYFCKAQASKPNLDMQASIEYSKALGQGSFAAVEDDRGDESLMAIGAAALMRERDHTGAEAIWKQLQEKAVRPGFGERIGCAMTFDSRVPVVATGWPLKEPYRSPLLYQSKLASVTERVLLKADLTKAQGVSIVMFFVDSKLVGMTNHEPFQYGWDTTQAANGPHTVRIVGCDSSGLPMSEKTALVVVRNKDKAGPSSRVTGDAADAAWGRLWEALRLKPSACAVNYNLALCAQERGDSGAAMSALERVLAANPGFADAEGRLAALYQARGDYARVYKSDGTDRLIALTFDDGPKEHTPELLDVLKAKGVRATFFLVGKQAEVFPEMVRRMKAEGHEIQNHTYNHRDLEYLSRREVVQEVFKTSAVVRAITGDRTYAVRPPGGHEGKHLPEVMKKFGMTTVMWTLNCSKLEGTTKKNLTNYVLTGARPGAIVLMHNYETVTTLALPEIIDALIQKGYRFATLSELTR